MWSSACMPIPRSPHRNILLNCVRSWLGRGRWSVRGWLLQKIACGVEHRLHTQLLTHYNQWHGHANRCGIGHFTFFKKKKKKESHTTSCGDAWWHWPSATSQEAERRDSLSSFSGRRLDLASHPFVFHKGRFFILLIFLVFKGYKNKLHFFTKSLCRERHSCSLVKPDFKSFASSSLQWLLKYFWFSILSLNINFFLSMNSLW